jgi:hypothetical protein
MASAGELERVVKDFEDAETALKRFISRSDELHTAAQGLEATKGNVEAALAGLSGGGVALQASASSFGTLAEQVAELASRHLEAAEALSKAAEELKHSDPGAVLRELSRLTERVEGLSSGVSEATSQQGAQLDAFQESLRGTLSERSTELGGRLGDQVDRLGVISSEANQQQRAHLEAFEEKLQSLVEQRSTELGDNLSKQVDRLGTRFDEASELQRTELGKALARSIELSQAEALQKTSAELKTRLRDQDRLLADGFEKAIADQKSLLEAFAEATKAASSDMSEDFAEQLDDRFSKFGEVLKELQRDSNAKGSGNTVFLATLIVAAAAVLLLLLRT